MRTRNNYLPTVLLLILAAFACRNANAVPAAFPQAAAPAGNTAEAHLGRGYDALKQDRYDVAVTEFRAALALNPKWTFRARFPLAVALFESHQYAEARKQFEAVRRVVGDHPNVMYYLGRLDLNDLNFKGAIENLNKAAVKPPFPDTTYYLGFAYFKQGDLASAEKWFKEAAQADPTDARVQYQLAMVYRREGKEDEAKAAVALSDQQRQRDDAQSRLKVECAQKLDQGPQAAAEAVCNRLYDPDNVGRLTTLGVLYGQHGDLQAALKPLRRAAELSPQSPQMQYNLALAYYQLNRFEDARVPLAETLKRWPDLFPLNALYGAVLMKLGDPEAAYPTLRHAQDLNPQDREVGNLLYFASMELAGKRQAARQYSDALTFLQEAARVRPLEPEPHRRMAEIYKLTGRSAQAEGEIQEAGRLARNLGEPQ